MTHPMLEKVARAIAHECNFISGEDGWRDELIAARAAIQALLEPDEAMIAAGSNEDSEMSVCAYRAMLLPLVEGEGR